MNELTISSQPSTLSPATQLLDSILRVKQSWKILLVDDRAYFHKLTKVILKNFEFEGKPLEFISAYSGKEAEEIITANPDIAVILLDVVMETDHAGLKVVKYIRDQIKNKLVRIILRTGNPEEAPEESVIINYDINDYKTKGELSQKKLITTMVAALRSYRDVRDLLKIRLQLQDTNRQLEHKVKLRTQELEARNLQLQQEIKERQETEKALKKLKEELEIRVEQRTLELINLNQQLSQEIEVRNEIEITLRQQEEFLRSIWEGVDEIILVVDVLSGEQFRYVAFNPALERFKVMSGVQILGKTVEEALPPAMATIWTSHYQNCVEAGTTISFEERLEIEGQESWWLTSLSPLKDENNQIVQLIITATNISDRKQMEEALRSSEHKYRSLVENLSDGNALKFTEVGEIKITVKTEATSKEEPTITIQLTVEDTGIGIAREQQERVFDAFIQSEGQSTRKYGGTGLGLGITKRLTEMLGGTVSLNSELGRGSTFTFIFPEVAIADEISSQESDLDLDEDLEQFAVAKVLVVDDVASNRHLIEGFFNQSKHVLLMAEDGEEGIKLARQEKPDLILLDLLMPNLDGRSAAQELKQDRETKQIPIVIVTASSPREDEENLQSLCQGFLRKPFSRHQLVSELKKVLRPQQSLPREQLVSSEATATPAPAKLLELVAKLDEIEETLWPELCQTMKMRDLRQLSQCLQQWGQEYQSSPLLEYATTLTTQIQEFDGEALPKTIHAFPQLRRSLEILYSESQ